MKRIVLFVFLIVASLEAIYADSSEDLNPQLVKLKVESKFDRLYPLDIKEFFLFQGDKQISYEDFIELSKDKYLIERDNKVKKLNLSCITTSIVLGSLTTSFLIPSIVFIALYAKDNYLEEYKISGVAMILLSCVSVISIFVELSVFFTLIAKNKNNEKLMREAVNRYNQKIKDKLGFIPDISFNDTSLGCSFKLKI